MSKDTYEIARLQEALGDALNRLEETQPAEADELFVLTTTGKLSAESDPSGSAVFSYLEKHGATLSPEGAYLLRCIWYLRKEDPVD